MEARTGTPHIQIAVERTAAAPDVEENTGRFQHEFSKFPYTQTKHIEVSIET